MDIAQNPEMADAAPAQHEPQVIRREELHAFSVAGARDYPQFRSDVECDKGYLAPCRGPR